MGRAPRAAGWLTATAGRSVNLCYCPKKQQIAVVEAPARYSVSLVGGPHVLYNQPPSIGRGKASDFLDAAAGSYRNGGLPVGQPTRPTRCHQRSNDRRRRTSDEPGGSTARRECNRVAVQTADLSTPVLWSLVAPTSWSLVARLALIPWSLVAHPNS
jgi:hypothetical protein